MKKSVYIMFTQRTKYKAANSRGGSGYVEGVSWFLGFLVSWLLGFKVSEFQGVKNPLMFLEDLGSILPDSHCMFSGRS